MRNFFPGAVCAAFILTACESTPASDRSALNLPNFNMAKLLGFDRTDEEKAWSDLLRNSDVRPVGSNQILVEAWGAPATDMERVELRLLARAGAEADKLGFDRFAIVHIRDRNMPITGGIFSTPVYGAERTWIGRYDELVESRYERDYAVAPRAWMNPGLTAIVQLVDDSHPRYDRAFKAMELYETLNKTEMP